jgi:hypothetical protein
MLRARWIVGGAALEIARPIVASQPNISMETTFTPS